MCSICKSIPKSKKTTFIKLKISSIQCRLLTGDVNADDNCIVILLCNNKLRI